MKISAAQFCEMMNESGRFRLHLDRLNKLEAIASETNADAKRKQMIALAKEACMWSPADPSDSDLRGLYALARAAVIAEGAARTAEFRKKWGVEISTLTLPE